jgi:serine protease Do
MNTIKKIFFAIAILGFGLGLGLMIGKTIENISSKNSPFPSAASSKGGKTVYSSYATAVKKSSRAVVNVFSEKKVKGISPLELFFGEEPESNQFSGEPYFFGPTERSQKSLGSGVLISDDGYILTNSHVIAGADKISISVSAEKQGTEDKVYEAKLLAMDSKTDLALLKISDSNLPFLAFGDSETLEVGDVVLAIGNPFGIGQTVTMGIISALKRDNLGIVDYEDFIQTDAAINPGNSGGALIDSQGNLVGINTAIFSKSGGYQGIGFAVPAKLAKKIADGLKLNGKITRTQLGVSVVNLSDNTNPLTAFMLEKGFQGALVIKVQKDGPADKAGINPGILITSINGAKIKSSEQLFKSVSESSPENPLDIKGVSVDMTSGKITDEQFSVQTVSSK